MNSNSSLPPLLLSSGLRLPSVGYRGRRACLQRKMPLHTAGRIGTGRPKGGRPHFKDFYAEWVAILRSTLLPALRQSISAASPHRSSDVLAARVCAVYAHFQSYFQALDLAGHYDVSQLLSPTPWRSSLERPFLWLGDFHPTLLTNLLRSFLRRRPPSRDRLAARVEKIERGIRKAVPSIYARFRDFQAGFLEAVVAEWTASKRDGAEAPAAPDNATEEQSAELVSVFLDANRLRKSVLAEIIEAVDVYQGALFLEALARFILELQDPLVLQEFEQSRMHFSVSRCSS